MSLDNLTDHGVRKLAPFGTWDSPISAKSLASKDITLLQISPGPSTPVSNHSDLRKIYYVEGRPVEQDRRCIVECTFASDGSTHLRDVLPSGYSAKTFVHGYGGGAVASQYNGNLIFADSETCGVYSLDPRSKQVECIVPGDKKGFFADFNAGGKTLQHWLLAIREDHRSETIINTVVAIDLRSGVVHTIVSGADFYSHPQLHVNTDGHAMLCWMQWDHPDMPWTGSQLFTAVWDENSTSHGKEPRLQNVKCVAGSPIVESVAYPRWSPYDDSLLFCSDCSGYWQLYRLPWAYDSPVHVRLQGLEGGSFAGPEWRLASSSFVILDRDIVVAHWTEHAVQRLVAINLGTSTYEFIGSDIIDNSSPNIERVSDTDFVVIGSTRDRPSALHQGSIMQDTKLVVIKSSSSLSIPKAYCSEVKPISFKRTKTAEEADLSYALFLLPQNPDFSAPENSLPPLIVQMHGGPTSHEGPGLRTERLYWTTRGYAFAAVNYSGSSGYSRAYRDSLDGQWGIADVADAVSCVEHLVSSGLVDGSRIGITGRSAGGYACLQALCSFSNVFAGGVSLFGVSDLKVLIQETHKFESHYLDRLLFGAKSDPSNDEKEKIFRERSPLYHADRIKAALLLLQGLEDKIVPPNQAQWMIDSLKKYQIDAKVVFFDGEGHGFNRAENVERSIIEQEQWWRKTLVRKIES